MLNTVWTGVSLIYEMRIDSWSDYLRLVRKFYLQPEKYTSRTTYLKFSFEWPFTSQCNKLVWYFTRGYDRDWLINFMLDQQEKREIDIADPNNGELSVIRNNDLQYCQKWKLEEDLKNIEPIGGVQGIVMFFFPLNNIVEQGRIDIDLVPQSPSEFMSWLMVNNGPGNRMPIYYETLTLWDFNKEKNNWMNLES